MLADQDMQAIGLRTYLIGAKGLAPVWTTVHWQMKGRGFSYTSPLLLCLLDPLGFREDPLADIHPSASLCAPATPERHPPCVTAHVHSPMRGERPVGSRFPYLRLCAF